MLNRNLKVRKSATAIGILSAMSAVLLPSGWAESPATKTMLPDLIVTKITMTPEHPRSGDQVVLHATIKNQGNAPTKAGVIIGVLFRVNGPVQSWEDTCSESLPPGASVVLTANSGPDQTATWVAYPGKYDVSALVDDQNRIVEENKSNNRLSRTITVDRTQPLKELHTIPARNARFSSVDINSGTLEGSRMQAGSTIVVTPGKDFDLTGGGHFSAPEDKCRFMYIRLKGDFEITDRIDSIDSADRFTTAQGGPMVRESLAAFSPWVKLTNYRMIEGFGGILEGRVIPGGHPDGGGLIQTGGTIPTNRFPVWQKLRRDGMFFNGYYSYDGKRWTPLGTLPVEMPDTVYVGVQANPGDLEDRATATVHFRDLRIDGVQAGPAPLNERSEGTGLTGGYFDGTNFDRHLFSRIDPQINFDFPLGKPPTLDAGYERYSIRWTGEIQPQYSETYTIYTLTDDGVRLWIDDKLAIDSWKDQGGTANSVQIPFEAGRKYGIRMDYFEDMYGGGAVLAWKSPIQELQIVPSDRLFPDASVLLENEPALSSLSESPKIVYQAENAVLGNGPMIVNDEYATGGKAVVGFRSAGSSISFTGVDGGAGGLHTAEIRYASLIADPKQSSLLISVNGKPIDHMRLWPTLSLGGRGEFHTLQCYVPLISGIRNTITLTNDHGSTQDILIDQLALDGEMKPLVNMRTP